MDKTYPMKLSYRILFVFFLFLGPQVFAQYTDLINTNRPGNSQGAYSVGPGVYQLEMGFGYGKEKHNLLNTQTTGLFTEYTVRIGVISEELEFSLTGGFQQHDIKYMDLGYSDKVRDFTSNTVGAKYLLYDPNIERIKKGPSLYSWRKNNRFQLEDLIPAVALYAGVNIDTGENPFIYENDFTLSPKFVLATQNNWIGGWVFVTNFVVDRISTDYPSYQYLLTLTKTMRSGTSMFVENHGIFGDFYSDQLIRLGVAQLINMNLHIDASVQVNFKDTPTKTYAKIGFAYRLDRHNDDEYVEEKKSLFGRKMKKERKQKEKKQKSQSEIEESGL